MANLWRISNHSKGHDPFARYYMNIPGLLTNTVEFKAVENIFNALEKRLRFLKGCYLELVPVAQIVDVVSNPFRTKQVDSGFYLRS